MSQRRKILSTEQRRDSLEDQEEGNTDESESDNLPSRRSPPDQKKARRKQNATEHHRHESHFGRDPTALVDRPRKDETRVEIVEQGGDESSDEDAKEGQGSLDGRPSELLLEDDRDGAEEEVEAAVRKTDMPNDSCDRRLFEEHEDRAGDGCRASSVSDMSAGRTAGPVSICKLSATRETRLTFLHEVLQRKVVLLVCRPAQAESAIVPESPELGAGPVP